VTNTNFRVRLTLLGLAICANTSAGQLPPGSSDPRAGSSLIIVPRTSRVCPGHSIEARYVERLANGTQRELSPRDVSLETSNDAEPAAEPRRDGSWQTNASPMRSVFTGFRLSAKLVRDSSVRGDTVVAPSYECERGSIRLPISDGFHTTKAYVRLGTFATPFYDSIVVAVVELEGGPPMVTVLSSSEMRPGALKISAPGKKGTNGRPGRTGSDGASCANGDQGEDGEPGEPGQPGGEVDIIVQDGSPWLADLVAVANPGGRGGDGGAPGLGGRAGPSGRAGGASCPTTRQGRSGRPGRPAPDGAAGPPPQVTSVFFQLLWPGSPIWSDPAGKRAIEQLTAFDTKKKG
jgi:hypothetical protein